MYSQTLDITDLRIFPSKKEGSPVKAYCHATFNNSLVVSGIRIRQGKKGVFVSFPFASGSNGKLYPVVLPANKEARKSICNRILATWVINHCVDDYTV